MYDDCKFDSCPKNEEHPWSTTDYRENHEENLKGYYAAITAMDYNVGRILAKLDSLNIRKDTLVWFLSDNGFNFGHHGIWGKGNGTFPQNMYDTSIKVPAIVSQPEYIKKNQRSDTMVSGYDFMPTLLDYLGLKIPNEASLPGKSIAAELKRDYKKQTKEEDENIVIFDEYGPVRMIRNKSWKYIHRYPYGPHELYVLTNDPNETSNLTNEQDYYIQVIYLRNQLES